MSWFGKQKGWKELCEEHGSAVDVMRAEPYYPQVIQHQAILELDERLNKLHELMELTGSEPH